MKKIIILLILLVLVTGCINNKNIIKGMGISNNTCRIVEEKDTHGGFLGDGDYFAKIKCDNLKVSDLTKSWYILPIPENLKEILEMKQCDSKSCKSVFEKYNIPEVTNGYYYFLDRQTMATNGYDDNERSSYNFTFAIADFDNSVIYYYELDT